MQENGPDQTREAQTTPRSLSDSERRLEATIDELTHLGDNPEALSQRLDAAVNQANDDCLGEAVTLINYGANQLASFIKSIPANINPQTFPSLKHFL